jgi:hypothetical protein
MSNHFLIKQKNYNCTNNLSFILNNFIKHYRVTGGKYENLYFVSDLMLDLESVQLISSDQFNKIICRTDRLAEIYVVDTIVEKNCATIHKISKDITFGKNKINYISLDLLPSRLTGPNFFAKN